ncbi:MAG: hypothetical protein ABII79_10745 [bacterium]
MKEITGRIFRLDHEVDTVVSLPDKIKAEILICPGHFSCGRAAEQMIQKLKAAGVRAVVAPGFDRSFYRQAINQGLAAVIADIPGDADSIRIDLDQGRIFHSGGETTCAPYPPFMQTIIETGDLIAAAKKELGKK